MTLSTKHTKNPLNLTRYAPNVIRDANIERIICILVQLYIMLFVYMLKFFFSIKSTHKCQLVLMKAFQEILNIWHFSQKRSQHSGNSNVEIISFQLHLTTHIDINTICDVNVFIKLVCLVYSYNPLLNSIDIH